MSSIPKAVPSAIAPSAKNSVPVLTDAQLGPYQPMKGSAIIPVVPVTEGIDPAEVKEQPGYGGGLTGSVYPDGGSAGAPSVPEQTTALFTSPPIDPHYVSEYESANPYGKVNNPPTRGRDWSQRIQTFLNHIALAPQDVDANGFRTMPPQQRTSVMRNTLPPRANGYSPETFEPHQMPQRPNTYKYNPAIGTQAYGTGVLNSDQFGAGQTAGGQGGNQYTPTPGPPVTNSTADTAQNPASMPTWG